MPLTMRLRKLTNGNMSLYLDIYYRGIAGSIRNNFFC